MPKHSSCWPRRPSAVGGIDTETAESRFAKGYEAAVKQFSLFGVSAADMPSDEEIRDYMTTYLLPEVAAGGTRALEEINKQIWIPPFHGPHRGVVESAPYGRHAYGLLQMV